MRELLINGRFLTQRCTGVHRYAFDLCSALHDAGVPFTVLAPRRIRPDYHCSFNVKHIGYFSSHLWEQVELPLYVCLHRANAILLNFTGLGSILYKHTICTIHDIAFLKNPKWFSKPYYLTYKFLTPKIARRALSVITVSQFSKSEIVRYLHLSPNKISVIPCAVPSTLLQQRQTAVSKTDTPLLLAVSSIDPRKNFERLIKAFQRLPSHINCQLCIVGTTNNVFNPISTDANASYPRITFKGYLNDADLATLYNRATAFVYPSLYEGFGLPPLEAMHFGCPALVSDIAPAHEICGDAVLYCNPLNTADIAAKMAHILNDETLRDALKIKGQERAKHFSWTKSAQQLIALLEQYDISTH